MNDSPAGGLEGWRAGESDGPTVLQDALLQKTLVQQTVDEEKVTQNTFVCVC